MAKAKKTYSKNSKMRKIKVHVSHRKSRPARKAVVSHRMSDRTKARRANARKESKLQAQKLELLRKEKELEMQKENERVQVETVLENQVFADFISKNVGKKAISIIKLIHNPQTDEKLAADLGVKINEVRRILNVLDSYGVARYDTNKDSKGWLTFKWYLDSEKLNELHIEISNRKPESAYKLQEDCNDFFYCAKCYDEQKVVLPFDAAYEIGFKCENCGKQLKQLDKQAAGALFDSEAAEQQTTTVEA